MYTFFFLPLSNLLIVPLVRHEKIKLLNGSMSMDQVGEKGGGGGEDISSDEDDEQQNEDDDDDDGPGKR